MSTFFRIVLRNIAQGPATIKYPFEDTPVPEKLRGKIKHNPDLCLTCHICEYVCAGGAIRFEETADKKGVNFMLWHNTCTFCGLCAHYCPTKAIQMTNDYHTAHRQSEKFAYMEKTLVKKQLCICCGAPIIPLPKKMLELIYGQGGDLKGLSRMCPQCRRKALWKGGFANYVRRGHKKL